MCGVYTKMMLKKRLKEKGLVQIYMGAPKAAARTRTYIGRQAACHHARFPGRVDAVVCVVWFLEFTYCTM